MINPPQAKKHCQDVNIYLVGENQFQNDLLVVNLKKIQGCECVFTVSSNIARVPKNIWFETGPQSLICLDCHGLSTDALVTSICTVSERMSQRHHLALYNLPPGVGIEKKALGYGVCGFFYPDNSPDIFCKGIRGILQGDIWLSRKILTDIIRAEIAPDSAQLLHDGKNIGKLSFREKEILTLLVTGAKNDEIAAELFLSTNTIRTHLYKIFKKIEVSNRTKASSWASKHLS